MVLRLNPLTYELHVRINTPSSSLYLAISLLDEEAAYESVEFTENLNFICATFFYWLR